jgi:hypothetical protein
VVLFFFLSLLNKNGGGAVYIHSDTSTKMNYCMFSGNTATNGKGHDIFLQGSASYYSDYYVTNCCSQSDEPRISSFFEIGSILTCSFDSITNVYSFCILPSAFCGNYSTKNNCDLRSAENTIDGPCAWILVLNGQTGNCVPKSYVKSCDSFVNDTQCVLSENTMNVFQYVQTKTIMKEIKTMKNEN